MTSIHWVGSFDPKFSRNRYLRALFAQLGVDVVEHSHQIVPADRDSFLEGSLLRLAFRALGSTIRILAGVLMRPAPDVYFASYPGFIDLPAVRLAAWLRRRPLIFDPFISLHDTIVSDRRLLNPGTVGARLLRWLDRIVLRLPDLVVADTPEHARFFAELSGTDESRFRVVRVGADERVFLPIESVQPVRRRVLFYGTYVPLQGVSTIVEAASLIADSDVHFRLIGEGQDRAHVEALVRAGGQTNVEFVDSVPLHDLNDEMQLAEVVLGVFGTSDKAMRVVPHKVYEACAAGRPLVTASTPAIASAFDDDEVVVVPPGDPVSLAGAITRLLDDPAAATQIAHRGHRRFVADYSQEMLAAALGGVLETARRGGQGDES